MSKPKAAQASLALSYVGGEVNNIPARDLSEDDIAWLASEPWVRRRIASGPPSLVAALVASGVYVVAADKAAASEQPSVKE